MGTACNRQLLTLPTARASAARSQCTYRLSTGSLLGMYGAMRHVLPQSRKTISLSGQPGSRDSACKSHPPHAIFQARLESHQDMVLGAVKAVLECHGHLSRRICLMVSSIWGKYPAALDENAWLKHEGSHVCLAGYVGHVIPCVRVCKAGQHHLVVIASQHHVDGQFYPIAHDSVF